MWGPWLYIQDRQTVYLCQRLGVVVVGNTPCTAEKRAAEYLRGSQTKLSSQTTSLWATTPRKRHEATRIFLKDVHAPCGVHENTASSPKIFSRARSLFYTRRHLLYIEHTTASEKAAARDSFAPTMAGRQRSKISKCSSSISYGTPRLPKTATRSPTPSCCEVGTKTKAS